MAFCTNCGASVPRGARYCPSCAHPLAEDRPSEERKLATVLFADLAGSTEFADSEDAERTRSVLNRFYDTMAAEIADAGGTVEKFIGDAVMAAFGAPASQEDHAERALHAALSMQQKLADLFGGALRLRIGVNTGDVIVGELRVGSSFVSGDAVNVAARLEQAAKPGEILVGERTAAIVRDAFEFDESVTIAAKGKASGVACRRLARAVSRAEPSRAAPPSTSFVGREPELKALEEAYEGVAAAARPALVVIVGEPGIGKSTIVRELWGWLGRQSPEPLRRVGRCRSYGQGNAYWPLGEVVREHFELESDSAETIRSRLGPRSLLALMLGLEPPPDLHPLAARRQLHGAWASFLRELTARQPAVLLVEDVHWADSDLLEILASGLRASSGALLLLATARPEFVEDHPGWCGEHDLLRLDALSAANAGRLVDDLVPTALPPALRAVLVERAEGNPFFAEELVRSLIDEGVLRRENGGWVADDLPAGFRIPDTVRALLSSRIDLLEPADKAALQAASVVGRTFWAGSVRELVERYANLTMLEERDFIRRQATSSMRGEEEFVFKHALTREVAYEGLTKAIRLRLHAGFAGWLEAMGEGRDEHAPILAHHYAEAVRPEDVDLAWPDDEDEVARLHRSAVAWLRRAANLAIGRYEMQDAVNLLERAVELEPDPGAQAEIWQDIAHANALYFDGKAFADAMEAAIALAEGDGALADLYAELVFQTMARAGMWGTAPPSDLVQGWIDRALELAAPDTVARAKALIARCYADYDKSAEDAAEASAIADRLGDPALRSRGYDVRHLVAFVQGDYREALEWCRRRESFVHELADPDSVSYVYAFAINPAVACGELDEARRYAALHENATSPLSPHHRLHGAALLLLLEELLGNWERALELQELIERRVAESAATPCVLSARSLYLCALANAYLGNKDDAERLEAKAEPLAMSGYGTVLDTPRLLLALHRGDLAAVESLLGEPAVRASNWFYLSSMTAHFDGLAAIGARERVEGESRRALQPGTYLEPFALRALGIVRGDRTLLERAADRFEAFGLGWHAVRTRELF